MAIYRISGMGGDGQSAHHFFEANSEEIALAAARKRGIFPEKVKAVASAKGAAVFQCDDTRPTLTKPIELKSQVTCPSCKTYLTEGAVFCSSCGTSIPENGYSFDESIEIAAAIQWVVAYAEAVATIMEIDRLADEAEQMAKQGHRVHPSEAKRRIEAVTTRAREADRVVAEAKTKLQGFDRERLIAVRDGIIRNESIPDSNKVGLRLDPAGIFGPSGQRLATKARPAEHNFEPSLSGGYGKLAATNAGRPLATQASHGPAKATTATQTPIGLYFAIFLLLIAVLTLIVAVIDFLTSTHLTSLTVYAGGSSLALFFIGGVLASSACPNCHLLFTSETLDSELVGSQMTTRTEKRVARHYNPLGSGIQGETHYDVDVPVHVQNFVHTNRCTKCGHVWRSRERRES